MLDMVRSMMARVNLPISFWGDALLSTTYILNHVSSKSVPSTPYEIWKGKKYYLSIMCPWGGTTYIHNTPHEYGKLGPMRKKCIFIRYAELSNGYVFLGEDMYGRVIKFESQDIIFLEDDFPKRSEINGDFLLYDMEDPEVSESARQIDLAPI